MAVPGRSLHFSSQGAAGQGHEGPRERYPSQKPTETVKIGRDPKGNVIFPAINFQGRAVSFRERTFSKSVMEFTTEFTCFDQCLLLWGVEGSMQNQRINHRAFTTRKGVDATTAKANVFARIWDVLGTYLRFKRGLPWEQDSKNKSIVLRFQKRNQQRFPSLQAIDIPGVTFPLPNIL